MTFDTLKFVETLKASGFDEAQAKGMVSAMREVQDTHLDELATKRDVDDLRRDMKELELRMVVKLGAMILAGIGLLFGLMRTWPLPVQYVPSPHSQEAPAYHTPIQPPR